MAPQPWTPPGQIASPGVFGDPRSRQPAVRQRALGATSMGWKGWLFWTAFVGSGAYGVWHFLLRDRIGGAGAGAAANGERDDCDPPPLPSSTEARTWLSENQNPNALANFTRREAENVVDRLYDAGASYVQVARPLTDKRRLCQEGGPYAAELMVRAPAAARGVIEDVLRAAGADEVGATKSGRIRGWWD